MAFTPAQQREYRKKLAGLGICVRCHRLPSMRGRVTCARCVRSKVDRLRAARKRWRNMPLRCPKCGREKKMERYRCEWCRVSEYGPRKRARQRRREAGLCTLCGGRLGDRAGLAMCQICNEASMRSCSLRRAMRG